MKKSPYTKKFLSFRLVAAVTFTVLLFVGCPNAAGGKSADIPSSLPVSVPPLSEQIFTVTFGVDGGHGTLKALPENGTESVTSSVTVPKDKTVTFTAVPEENYVVDKWEITGGTFETDTGIPGSDTAKVKITSSVAVKVSFKPADPQKSAVSFRVKGNTGTNTITARIIDGEIIASGNEVEKNKTVEFTATADAGWRVKSWTISGSVFESEPGAENTAKAVITTPVTVEVEFEQIFTVTFGVDSGHGALKALPEDGTESVTSSVTVPKDKTVTFTAVPKEGCWQVKNWTVVGGVFEEGTGNSADKTAKVKITGNVTVNVSFEWVVSDVSDVYNTFYEKGYNGGTKGPILITRGILKTNEPEQDVYLVWLSGTEDVEGQDTNVTGTDKNAYGDRSTNYLRSILRTIGTDVPNGSNLIFAGHSLGGMVAQQAAGYAFIKRNYNVRTVLTFGSPPVGSVRCEGKAVRFADTSDMVPTLSYEYKNDLVYPADKVITKDGGYNGNKMNSHSNSYKRKELWGMYDALGTENGNAKVILDMDSTAYYKAPSVFPENAASAPYSVSIGGQENFVLIEAKDKTFQMGNASSPGYYSEKPVHAVTLKRNFYMCTHETTQGEYEAVMGKNESEFKTPDTVADKKVLPVEMCSWYDAIMYCNKRSLKEELKPCYAVNGKPDPAEWNYIPNEGNTLSGEIKCDFDANGYRLPTEAEWEFAARAGNTNTDKLVIAGGAGIEAAKYKTHSSSADKALFVEFCKELCKYTWTFDNLTNATHEVKMLQPNAWGLYDMSGNVAEWCWDKYASYPNAAQTDPNTGDSVISAGKRVVRGGTYYLYSGDCSVTARSYAGADYRYYNGGWSYGFRVVRTAK